LAKLRCKLAVVKKLNKIDKKEWLILAIFVIINLYKLTVIFVDEMIKNNMKHCVYLLISEKDPNWIYCGYSNNPKRRLGQHNGGRVTSTTTRKPFKMIVIDEFVTKEEAVAREKQIKKSSKKKKVLVKEYLNK